VLNRWSQSDVIQIETPQPEQTYKGLDALGTAMRMEATLLADIEEQLGYTPQWDKLMEDYGLF